MRVILAICLLLALPFSAARADLAGDAKDLRQMAEGCVDAGRDVCTVFAATQVLTSLDLLDHLGQQDPSAIAWFAEAFEKASFRVSQDGRPSFRKFLAENALWTMDFYNERFRAQTETNYQYENTRHFYAAYQLLRADACDELANEACASSALWHVKNAQDENYWPQIVERFEIEEEIAVTLLDRLMTTYKDRI